MRIYIALLGGIGLYLVLRRYFGDRTGESTVFPNYIFAAAIWIVGAWLVFGIPYYGNKVPGSFFARDKYEGWYYVEIYSDTAKTKIYRVPAYVEATGQWTMASYRISHCTIPDYGPAFFSVDSHIELDSYQPNFDHHRRTWHIKLLGEPAPTPRTALQNTKKT